jgi:hypothetical protein
MSDQKIQRRRSARLTYPGVAMLFGADGSIVPARVKIENAGDFRALLDEKRKETALAVLAVGRSGEVDPKSALHTLYKGRPKPDCVFTKAVAIKGDNDWGKGCLIAPPDSCEKPQIALLAWHVEHGGVKALSEHVREALKAHKIAAPTVDALAVGLGGVATDTKLQLALIRGELTRWERRFRYGESLTEGQHERVEEALAALAGLKDAAQNGNGLAAEHAALEARFDHLLEAQASRDATGALERVVSVLAALVLVPGLVAGVYGANVSIPLEGTRAGFRAMLGLMALGAATTYIGLSAIRPSAVTRSISVHVPGAPRKRDDQDLSWLPRPILCGLAGGAIGAALNAVVASGHLRVLRDAPTTGIALLAGLAILAAASLVIVGADWEHRSRIHAVLDLVVVGTTCGTVYWFLREDLAAIACVVVLAAPTIAFLGRRGVRKWLCCRVRRHDVD